MNLADLLDMLAGQVPSVVGAIFAARHDGVMAVDPGERLSVAIGGGLPRRREGIDGIRLEPDTAHRSISAALLNDGGRLLERLAALRGRPVSELLANLAFFVKDASPDSVVAVFLVLAHLCGVDGGEVLRRWVAAVTEWDKGFMPTEPFRSWPALASSLAHARFPLEPGASATDSMRAAWSRVFLFLVRSLRDGHDPDALPPSMEPPGSEAVAALHRMHQLYDDILVHATVLQLSVPLRDAPDRWLTVNALCYVEDEPSDAVKVFGPGDRARSPGGRGFALAACYRPRANDWNRFTVRADPVTGLDLTALWVELERLETERWTEPNGDITRQTDAATPTRDALRGAGASVRPRSFRAEQLDRLVNRTGAARPLAGVENWWVNPWFLFPDGSLVASPGKDLRGVNAGPTRLEWRDVVGALWASFHPLRGVKVRACSNPADAGALVELLRAPPIDLFGDEARLLNPRFRYLKWPAEGEQVPGRRGLALDDTTVRTLAALAESSVPAPIDLEQLPPPGASRLVHLNGGFAVVAQGGCIVVDDWQDHALDREKILRSLRCTADWRRALEEHAQGTRELDDRFGKWLTTGKDDREAHEVLTEVAACRSRFARDRAAASLAQHDDPNARVLSEALTSFWGLPAREAFVEQSYVQIEQSVRSLHEARTARIARILGLYILPAYVAGYVARPFAVLVNQICVKLGWKFDPVPDYVFGQRMALGEGLSWLAWTVILTVAMKVAMKRFEPKAVRRSEDTRRHPP
jgi:hypothetical protein